MDAATFANKPVLRAMRDADRILESTKGTKFYEGIKDQIGRDLADVCIKNGILGKQCYIYCDIISTGQKKQYNFLGVAKHGMIYTDAESFDYHPYCVVLADLKKNEVKRDYEAILFPTTCCRIYTSKDGRTVNPMSEVESKVHNDDFLFTKVKKIKVRHSHLDRSAEGLKVIDGKLEDVLNVMKEYEGRLDKFIHS